jgi:hypothetical protein
MIELLLQEAFTEGQLKDFEPDPSTITISIAQDPKVPGGWAISAKGRQLANADAEGQWLRSGDTGVSSIAIYTAMLGGPTPILRSDQNWPHDPSDFGRCFRLLERFPDWRNDMSKVSKMFPAWAPIINVWPELEDLYREEIKNPRGMAPKLYARLQTLGDECMSLSGWTKTDTGWSKK